MIFLKLFLQFLKIGVIAFGGGYAMIPVFKETCINNSWVTEDQFYDFIGVCESTPGPIAVNLATFIGTSVAGPLGGAVATIGVILPAFVIILILAVIISKFLNSKIVKSTIKGIQPAVIALILSASIVLILTNGFSFKSNYEVNYPFICILVILSIVFISFQRLTKKKISSVYIILFGAILGLISGLIF